MAEGPATPNPRRRSLPVVAVPDDCTHCGACCRAGDATFIAVFAADRERMQRGGRLGALAEALVVERAEGTFLRFRDGRCAALDAIEGRDGAPPRHLCGIYEVRPDVCRWLQPGSGTCRELIEAAPPLT